MKLSKVLSMVVIALMLLAITSNLVYASGAVKPGDFTGNQEGTSSIANLGNRIVGIIQVVGTIGSVAVLVILGVKYMMGSTEEKAEYKKTLMPYVIGAVLVFAASNVAGFLFNWASSIS